MTRPAATDIATPVPALKASPGANAGTDKAAGRNVKKGATGSAAHPFRTGQPVIYFHVEGQTVRPILAAVGNVIFDLKGRPACSLKCTIVPVPGDVDARQCLPLSALEILSSDCAHGLQLEPEPLQTAVAGVVAVG